MTEETTELRVEPTLADELAALHEAARGCEFDLVPADGPVARLALFMHEHGDRIAAALAGEVVECLDARTCPDCEGAGRHADESNCSLCDGSGCVVPYRALRTDQDARPAAEGVREALQKARDAREAGRKEMRDGIAAYLDGYAGGHYMAATDNPTINPIIAEIENDRS